MVSIEEFGGANTTCVTIGAVELYFSYKTVVAFYTHGTGRVVSENVWTNTTGKHLNAIDGGDKKSRLKNSDFDVKLKEMLVKHGLSK